MRREKEKRRTSGEDALTLWIIPFTSPVKKFSLKNDEKSYKNLLLVLKMRFKS